MKFLLRATSIVSVFVLAGCGPSKTEIAELQNRASRSEKKLAELTAKNAALEANLADLTATNAASAAELAAKNAKLVALEAERSKADKAAAEESRRVNLTVQVGVTMQSGDTRPVNNTTIYLGKKSLASMFPDGVVDYDATMTKAAYVWLGAIGKNAIVYQNCNSPALILKTVEASSFYRATTDFSGKASFEGVEPGTYFILCASPLGGGEIFEKSVNIRGKSTTVALSNQDIVAAH